MTQHRLVIDVETELDGKAAAEHVGAVIDAMPLVELASPVYYRPWEDEEDEPDYSAPEPVKSGWPEWLTVVLLFVGIAIAISMAFG